jgi:uncharacterized protein YndB with AHSA1/START domain
MRSAFLFAIALAMALCGGPSARAAIVAAEPYGFQVSHQVTIAAAPDRVWAAIGRIGGWWASMHTFSSDARNLHLSMTPGGCWCEQLPGGGAQHMTVVVAEPGKILQLEGGLGPLGAPGAPSGRLTFSLTPTANGTALSVTFEGGGWAKDGASQWAPPIDHVLGEQVERLKRYAETGRPD